MNTMNGEHEDMGFSRKTLALTLGSLKNHYTDTSYVPQFTDVAAPFNDTMSRGMKQFFDRLDEEESKDLLRLLIAFKLEDVTSDTALKGIEQLYDWLDDAESKDLLCLLIAFKLAGRLKVKLPLYDKAVWDAYLELPSAIKREGNISSAFGAMNVYNLSKWGFDIDVLYSQLGTFLTFLLKQYEYRDICKVREGDCVIDGGACYGDSALYFASLAGGRGKVYSFEFIKSSINIFKRNLAMNPRYQDNVEIVMRPLGKNSKDIIKIVQFAAASHIVKGSSARGILKSLKSLLKWKSRYQTISIDDFVAERKLEKVDFIKLDIEGGEVNALRGATETIRKFKPRLAIALYHRFDDFFTIPQLIKEIRPDYKFFLGHYTVSEWETVLYAV